MRHRSWFRRLAVCALALGAFAAAPSAANAQFSTGVTLLNPGFPTGTQPGFSVTTIIASESSTLTFTANQVDQFALDVDFTIALPEGAELDGSASSDTTGCTVSATASTGGIDVSIEGPDETDCDVAIPLKFMQYGDFDWSDFAVSGADVDDASAWDPTQPALSVLLPMHGPFVTFMSADGGPPVPILFGEPGHIFVGIMVDDLVPKVTSEVGFTITVTLPAGVTVNTASSSWVLNFCPGATLTQSGRNLTMKGTMTNFAGPLCTVPAPVSFAAPGTYAFVAGGSATAATFTPDFLINWIDVSESTPLEVLPLDNGGDDDDNPSPGTPAPSVDSCSDLPDLAVSPQFIEIAPGGRATVELSMRNLCSDAPFAPSDLLISFSDGLTVVETSGGIVAMGGRAADQRVSLAPGETKRWSVTVEAAAELTTPPLHITEHFVTGRETRRIDGVFIAQQPAPAAPEPAAVPAPAPAPLPTALPNTSGVGGLLPTIAAALSLLTVGYAVLRRRS